MPKLPCLSVFRFFQIVTSQIHVPGEIHILGLFLDILFNDLQNYMQGTFQNDEFISVGMVVLGTQNLIISLSW